MATNLPVIPFLLAGPLLRVSTGVGSQAHTGTKAHAFRLPSSLFCCLSFPLEFNTLSLCLCLPVHTHQSGLYIAFTTGVGNEDLNKNHVND